jgi:hypothetical protein
MNFFSIRLGSKQVSTLTLFQHSAVSCKECNRARKWNKRHTDQEEISKLFLFTDVMRKSRGTFTKPLEVTN